MHTARRSMMIILIALLILLAATTGILIVKGQPAKQTTLPKYILKEYNGKVAVFSDGQQTPQEILEIDLSALPDTDQEQLFAGIEVDNETQLQQYIEDFDG